MEKLQRVIEYAKNALTAEITAHDFSHSYRVMKIARFIALKSEYDVDMEVIEVAGLTHDIVDKKVALNVEEAINEMRETLIRIGYSKNKVLHVQEIIKNISYSSGKTPESMEGKIVQDADRLDAIGAVAIARTFAYGGKLNRVIYEEGDENCSIAHFYDKLLLLKDMMNTEIGKSLAISRHRFMEDYLRQFYKEFNLLDMD